MDPITTSAIGGLVGTGASALLNRRRVKLPSIDPLLKSLTTATAGQKNTLTGAYGKLPALGTQYKTDVGDLASGLVDSTGARSSAYVTDASTAASKLGTNLFDQNKQRILGQSPELSQNLDEALAANGTRRSGAGLAAHTKLQTNLSAQLADANNQVTNQELATRSQALKDAFTTNQGAAEKATGLNAATLEALFSSGRADLINEALGLIGIDQNDSTQRLGIMEKGQDRQLASDLAKRQVNNDLLNSLLSGTGRVVGSRMGK